MEFRYALQNAPEKIIKSYNVEIRKSGYVFVVGTQDYYDYYCCCCCYYYYYYYYSYSYSYSYSYCYCYCYCYYYFFQGWQPVIRLI